MAVFNYPVLDFEALLVLFTFALVIVGVLQWQTLRKTDGTLKARTRPWVDIDAKLSIEAAGTRCSRVQIKFSKRL